MYKASSLRSFLQFCLFSAREIPQEVLSTERLDVSPWDWMRSRSNLQTSISVSNPSPSLHCLFQNSRGSSGQFTTPPPHPQIKENISKYLHYNLSSMRAKSFALLLFINVTPSSWKKVWYTEAIHAHWPNE